MGVYSLEVGVTPICFLICFAISVFCCVYDLLTSLMVMVLFPISCRPKDPYEMSMDAHPACDQFGGSADRDSSTGPRDEQGRRQSGTIRTLFQDKAVLFQTMPHVDTLCPTCMLLGPAFAMACQEPSRDQDLCVVDAFVMIMMFFPIS